MSDWKDFWQCLGIAVTIAIGLIGVKKVFVELKRIKEQREKEISDQKSALKLKKTDFFLDQHRRLFDNPELYEILCLIDSDAPQLADESMWDKKRKFLTFFEEIAFLVRSDYIDASLAFYMFGYYTQRAQTGKNFSIGINLSPMYWKLFYDFVNASIIFDMKSAEERVDAMFANRDQKE
ncbi:hypothetical protein [Glaciimonas sp. PCH181]|uniref:hypothetical protein n=1 Tax=Glaciimonas sp. PCH181 TaxID=2133943 RepID=UPI00191BDF8A|nr:hypothetical protein [Glaciimonas sp. PCH181]